jgi:hypothetical protein
MDSSAFAPSNVAELRRDFISVGRRSRRSSHSTIRKRRRMAVRQGFEPWVQVLARTTVWQTAPAPESGTIQGRRRPLPSASLLTLWVPLAGDRVPVDPRGHRHRPLRHFGREDARAEAPTPLGFGGAGRFLSLRRQLAGYRVPDRAGRPRFGSPVVTVVRSYDLCHRGTAADGSTKQRATAMVALDHKPSESLQPTRAVSASPARPQAARCRTGAARQARGRGRHRRSQYPRCHQ